MTPQIFRDLIELCADAPSAAERRAADVALIGDVAARIDASDYDYGITPGELLANASGGVRRAAMHFYYFNAASPLFYGRGSRIALSSSPRSAARAIARLEPATRRRWIHGWGAAGAAFTLAPIHEVITSGDFIVAAGSYVVELALEVWSRSPEAGAAIAVQIMANGAPVATHSAERPEPVDATPGKRRDQAVAFSTSDPVVIAVASVIAVVNAGAFDQLARGLLRIVPT